MRYFINQKFNAPGSVRARPSGGLETPNLCDSDHLAVSLGIISEERGSEKKYY